MFVFACFPELQAVMTFKKNFMGPSKTVVVVNNDSDDDEDRPKTRKTRKTRQN